MPLKQVCKCCYRQYEQVPGYTSTQNIDKPTASQYLCLKAHNTHQAAFSMCESPHRNTWPTEYATPAVARSARDARNSRMRCTFSPYSEVSTCSTSAQVEI